MFSVSGCIFTSINICLYKVNNLISLQDEPDNGKVGLMRNENVVLTPY